MFDVVKTTDELIEWIRNQVGNCNVVIGISGGKDSTICGMLSCLAIGADKVYGIMMPNGIQKDISDSRRVCNLLGINYKTVNIQDAYEGLCGQIGAAFDFESEEDFNDCYATNTPARIRMTTLYGIAAIIGNARVINTCNGDEDYVGYSTKFGDSAGDFSPLADFTVEEVLAIGVECAQRLGLYDDLKDLIFKTPDDGMSGKSDEDKLGFTYKVLGTYRRTGICEDEATKAKIDRMHEMNLHKIMPMPKFEYKGH